MAPDKTEWPLLAPPYVLVFFRRFHPLSNRRKEPKYQLVVRCAARRWRSTAWPSPPAQATLERDIVVHVAATPPGGGHRASRRSARRAARSEITTRIVRSKIAAATAGSAVEHGQGRVEILQHHFGRVFFHAALIGPFAGLQLAFDVNLGTLLQVLFGDLAKTFAENHHAMPLGFFLALTGALVAPSIRRGYPQIRNRTPVLSPLDFRISPEIADQNYLVHASRHRRSPNLNSVIWCSCLLVLRRPTSNRCRVHP